MTTQPDDEEVKTHEHCSVDCPCGHWNDRIRRPARRADGRRGKPNLDIIEENGDASR